VAAVPDLAVFDLDGTITRRDTLLPYIAGFLRRHPVRLWRLPGAIPPLLRFAIDRDRGRLKSVVVRRLLGGLGPGEISAWNREFIARLRRDGLLAGAMERIALHRAGGHRLVLLSASVDLHVPDIATALGFDEWICTRLTRYPDGRLEGRLATPNRRGEEKASVLRALLARHAPGHSYAYGNSDSDLAHLQLVDEGWFVNGPPALAAGLPSVRCVRWLASWSGNTAPAGP
jgi:HAD superfamily hydrolase (TIGR01490 family)